MRSIQPAVVSTMPQAAGTKAQALKRFDQAKPDPKTMSPVLPAAATIQNASATGGQK
jgi:hypothetical protein